MAQNMLMQLAMKQVATRDRKEDDVLKASFARVCQQKCASRSDNFNPVGEFCYPKCFDMMIGLYKIGLEELDRAGQAAASNNKLS